MLASKGSGTGLLKLLLDDLQESLLDFAEQPFPFFPRRSLGERQNSRCWNLGRRFWITVVWLEAGRPVIQCLSQIDGFGIERQHHRCLDDACMLKFDAGIAAGKYSRERVGRDEFPMVDTHQFETVRARRAQRFDGKFDTLDRWPDIFIMPIEHHDFSGSVAEQFADHVPDHQPKRLSAEIDRAWEL